MRRNAAIALLIVAATVVVYAPVVTFDFVLWDDPEYVERNPVVAGGLTAEGLRWALTTSHAANWHPLTWASHMLDVELFGLNPGRHHAVNLALHLMNTLVLFALLLRSTGRSEPSAFVAALFALHPLHVESVAWIAERKDVLSTLFWLTTMLVYVEWTRRGGHWRFIGMIVLFSLGLLAKPMLVTLPIVLMLWDRWPLERFAGNAHGGVRAALREKAPLFLIAAGAGVITLIVQARGGAMERAAFVSLIDRLANAAVSYVRYLGRTIFPADLAAFYPHPQLPGGVPWSAFQVLGAVGLLVLISVVVVRQRRQAYLPVGWCWYLITLLPVIGLIQVGRQAMADRYTYVPLIGIFIATVWGADALASRAAVGWPSARRAATVVGGAIVLLCALGSARQVRVWRDSVTLFRHALQAAGPSAVIQTNLGVALAGRGEHDEAERLYRAALELDAEHAEAHNGLGNLLRVRGELDQAVEHYAAAVRASPAAVGIRANLGRTLIELGRFDAAQRELQSARDRVPDSEVIDRDLAEAQYRLGLSLLRNDAPARDDTVGAGWLAAAAELGHADAQHDLGVLYEQGRGVTRNLAQARTLYRLSADAGHAKAQTRLGVLYVQGLGVPVDDAQAERWFNAAAAQGYAEGLFNLGMLHYLGRTANPSDVEAWALFEKAARKGDRAAVEWRNRCSARMTPAELEQARIRAGS